MVVLDDLECKIFLLANHGGQHLKEADEGSRRGGEGKGRRGKEMGMEGEGRGGEGHGR